MIRLPPEPPRTYPLFPTTTLFRSSIGCREACRGRLRRFCPPRHPCREMLIETLPAADPPAAVPGRPSSFAIEVPDALLGRARAGERAACEQVYRRFESPVVTLALDRKSGGQGKSVEVRVDIGGGRRHK